MSFWTESKVTLTRKIKFKRMIVIRHFILEVLNM